MMYTSPKFESEEAARSQVESPKTTSDGYQGMQSFAKGLAAAQTLHSVTGISNKPAC